MDREPFMQHGKAIERATRSRSDPAGYATRAVEGLETLVAGVHMVTSGTAHEELALPWAGISLQAQCAAMLFHDLSACDVCCVIVLKGKHAEKRCSAKCGARQRKRWERAEALAVSRASGED